MRTLVRNPGTNRAVASPNTVGTGVRRGRARVPNAMHWGVVVTKGLQRPWPSCWTGWRIWKQKESLCGPAGGVKRLMSSLDGSGSSSLPPSSQIFLSPSI